MEIGHYLLHKDSDRVLCGSLDIANWTNFEANPGARSGRVLASELLLPSAEMKASICTQWPSLKLVSDLAEEFEASLTATIRKYCEVGDAKAALGSGARLARPLVFPVSGQFPALDQSRRRGGMLVSSTATRL